MIPVIQPILEETSLHLRNAFTRMPFRYGSACLTACPQAILRVVIEHNGVTQAGYSGDALPPGWFDKRPTIPYRRQIADQVAVIGAARDAFATALTGDTPFAEAWRFAYDHVHEYARGRDLPGLLASFGHSLVERAMIDALCRAEGRSFDDAVRDHFFGIEPASVIGELAPNRPADWLPAEPATRINVRHTVGLVDPLTPADVPPHERLNDGLPQTLEEYVRQSGLGYFKIKVSNRLDHDVERLKQIVGIVEAVRGSDYTATLDGNEQYGSADDFEALIEGIRKELALETFWRNVVAIEQPLNRAIAMDPAHTAGIAELGTQKPVIIDESDDTLDAYTRAIGLGYRGVSSKACKGPIKSILNAGVTWQRNQRSQNNYLITGEDLTCVGMVSLQTDLALVATLGLTHVERNGHHYYHGLDYLPEAHQRQILEAHPDLYTRMNGAVGCAIRGGALEIGSLQCPGFGFAIEPDLTGTQTPETWHFDSLGLGER